MQRETSKEAASRAAGAFQTRFCGKLITGLAAPRLPACRDREAGTLHHPFLPGRAHAAGRALEELVVSSVVAQQFDEDP